MKRFLAWAGDRLLGPRCPYCIHRGSGLRSLDRHIQRRHGIPAAGNREPEPAQEGAIRGGGRP